MPRQKRRQGTILFGQGRIYAFLSLFIVVAASLSYNKLYPAKNAGEVNKVINYSQENPQIIMETTLGTIRLELYPEQAPETVANFLKYVESGFYNGTIFHRVIPAFMIQGGGFNPGLQRKQTFPPIKNEATNGLPNKRGTIAMARTNEINSATSQFFINLVDNPHLNHRNKTAGGYGYCVFGRVTEGMEVVDRIGKVPTGQVGPYSDVPREEIIILSVVKEP
ncbi:MAG: peptidyl-prolyl cis-trans isomerase [Firmicutes bacterium]|nr:peptidyl-prolyl cis-trans isomerase [Bacillota bacterium]